MKVVLSAQAEADLEDIGDCIALDNPRRALTFIQELRESCENLATRHKAFPLVPRYADLGVRRRLHGNYMIFYHAGPAAIEVLHILHGAMDVDAALFPARGPD